MKRFKLFLMLAATIGFVACRPNEEPTPTPEPQPQDSNIVVEPDSLLGDTSLKTQVVLLLPAVYSGNVVTTAWAAMQDSSYVGRPSISYDNATSYPCKMSLAYGQNNVPGIDGFSHFGLLSASLSAPYIQEGSVTSLDFTWYRTYGSTVSGEQTITNKGINAEGNMVWDVETKNGSLGINPYYVFSESTSRELISGMTDGKFDSIITNHVYRVKGWMKVDAGSGKDAWGYTATIVDSVPLIMPVGELYPLEGKMQVVFDPILTIDLEKVLTGEDKGKYKGVYTLDKCTIQFIGKGDGQSYWLRVDFKFMGIKDYGFRIRLTSQGYDKIKLD